MKERKVTGSPGRRVGQMRPHTVLESAAELRDAMRAEIRQLRAENQRLRSELAGKPAYSLVPARYACGCCSAVCRLWNTLPRTATVFRTCTDPDCGAWQKGEKRQIRIFVPGIPKPKGIRLCIPDQAQGRNRRHIRPYTVPARGRAR